MDAFDDVDAAEGADEVAEAAELGGASPPLGRELVLCCEVVWVRL